LEKTIPRHFDRGTKFIHWQAGSKSSAQATDVELSGYDLLSWGSEAVFSFMDSLLGLEKAIQARSARNLGKLGVLDSILTLQEQNRFPPDYADLEILCRVANHTQPKNILELGSGYSTLVFCHYLDHFKHSSNEPSLTSIEPSGEFAAMMASAVAAEQMEHLVRFISPGVKVYEFNAEPTTVFDVSLDGPFDMIYLDAAPKASKAKGADFILRNRQILKKGTIIVIDGRLSAFLYLMNSDITFHWLTNCRVYKGLDNVRDATTTYTTILQVTGT